MKRKLTKTKIKTHMGLPHSARLGVVFSGLSVAAILLGMAGGNLLSYSRSNLIKRMDSEVFKVPLNQSIPLIDTIYNSGNLNPSLMGELNRLLNGVFDFDLGNPTTVLNSQSPLLVRYYQKDYRQKTAKAENPTPPDVEEEGGEEQLPEGTPKPTESTGLKQDASSISTDEGSEERDYSEGNMVKEGQISVQNETKLKIDIQGLLKAPLNIKFSRKGPKVLIYHTHTSESYAQGWTSDGKYGVVRVGEEIAKTLRKKYGVDTIHNATINDFDFNSSYINGLKTVNNILKGNPSVQIVFDVHRDGLAKGSQKLRMIKKINGKYAAQLMFVVGTNATGLSHPNWKENLKLALRLQQKLNTLCPGLAKPIYISKNRYNEHVRNGALIVEIGGDGNSVDESVETAKYLAAAVKQVMDDMK